MISQPQSASADCCSLGGNKTILQLSSLIYLYKKKQTTIKIFINNVNKKYIFHTYIFSPPKQELLCSI